MKCYISDPVIVSRFGPGGCRSSVAILDNYLGLEKSRNTGFSPDLRNQFDTTRHFSINPTREI